ncbi:MAG: Fic family protein [Actinomycetaceae bacterium]|nr:Fic family protein [Actinomycetaceae bacterium]
MLNREIYELTEQIWQIENEIQRIWAALPPAAQNHFFFTLLIEEIQSTNEIENVQSTRREITEALQSGATRNASKPLKRFQEMANTFRLLTTDNNSGFDYPQTLKETRRLYDQLLGDEIPAENQPDGDLFRSGNVFVTNGTPKTFHQGVGGENEIKSRLGVMLEVSSPQNTPQLVNALLGHFMIEHIHPFYDGNGRFGRFLLTARLSQIMSAQTALSLSAEVMKQKRRYYKAFTQVEDPLNGGEATFFVTDMLGILLAAQEQLKDCLEDRWRDLKHLTKRINSLKYSTENLTEHQIHILYMLGQALLFGSRSGVTLQETAEFLKRSKQTVRSELKDLATQGLVLELSRKPLVFSLTPESQDLLGIKFPHPL